MMRRVLTILIVLLGVTCASAQAVWISADGYCQYAVIDFQNSTTQELKLTDKHRPSLDFISYLIDQFKDKIQTHEYQVWVESYVGDQQADFTANRALARKMSNVVKSHIILNDGLVEDNFKTRNYSGTFDGQSGVTVVVIGMRYPVEQIVPKQRLNYEEFSDGMVEGFNIGLILDSLSAQKVITAYGVDTIPVLYPKFEVMTLGGSSSNEVHSSGSAASTGHNMIDDDTLTVPKSVKLLHSGAMSDDHDQLLYDRTMEQGKQKNVIPGLIVDESFKEPGLPQFWPTDVGESKTTKPRSVVAVASGVTALTYAPGAVSKIIKLSTATNPITAAIGGGSSISRAQKSKHQHEVNKQIDEQLRQQKTQQKRDQLLAKEQDKQRVKDQKLSARNNRKGKTYATGERAQISGSGSTTADGTVGSTNSAGAEIMTFDKAKSQASWGSDDAQSADKTAQSSIDQDPQPMPFAPLSNYGTKKDDISSTLKTKKRGSKNLPLDGKSIEESINQGIIAERKVSDRVERAKKEQALREIVHNQKAERLRQIRAEKGRFAVAGIGVNLLSSAALIPSIQVDSYFSNRFSVSAEWYYSKWNYSAQNVFNVSMANLELRYFPMGKKKTFEGLYIGLYGGAGEYDFRWGTQDGRQSQFVSAGLSLGYVLPLGKSGFYFEAGISGGYVTEKIEKYIQYDQGYVRLNDNFTNSTIFAPTKIKLSIIYRIFNQKR